MADTQLDRYEDHYFLSTKKKAAYGMVGFGENVINEALFSNVMLFYNTILMVPAKWVGWALAGTRLWDAISDPVMGYISDNTRSRWGRRRPYILFASFFWAFFFILIMIPPNGWSVKELAWYLGIVGFFYFAASTTVLVPAGALGAELTLDYHERTRLNAWRAILSRVGAGIAASTWFLAGRFGTPEQPDFRTGFAVLGITWAVLGLVAFMITFKGTREIAEYQQQDYVPFFKGMSITLRNVPFIMLAAMVFALLLGIMLGFLAGSYINIYYVYGGDNVAAGGIMFASSMVFMVTCLLSAPVVSWIGVKIGKEKAMMIGMATFAIAPIVSWFVFDPAAPYLQLFFQIPVAIALTFLMVFAGAMVADLIDLDEVKTGRRREGSYSALLAFIFKLAAPVGTLGFSYLIDLFAHFDEKMPAQTPETIYRLRLILLVVPLIPLAISVILALLYPVREHQIREARLIIDQRRHHHPPAETP